jgi:hypothetical protein
MNPAMLSRRDALARIALLTGGAVIGGEAFLRGARGSVAPGRPFSPGELALMDEIGETIIPATDTPGAKSVGIAQFMAMMVRECYSPEEGATFRGGLGKIEKACRKKWGRGFLDCSAAQRTALLNQLGHEHYFEMLKQLTLLGYFTSETGCTRALRYIETPGSYDGDVAYRKGDRAWFVPPVP